MKRLVISLIAMVMMYSSFAADRLSTLPYPILGGDSVCDYSKAVAGSVYYDGDYWDKFSKGNPISIKGTSQI